MNITNGEAVYKRLFEEKGYNVKLFDQHLNRKSPDFKVCLNEELLFYCEVKDIEDLDNKYFEENIDCPDEVRIILQKIYDANKQFNSVNPDHNTPNILAFHCKRLGMDANDLHDAIFGYIEYSGGDRIKRRHRGDVESRLKDNNVHIDAFIFHHDDIDKYAAIYIKSQGFYGELIKKLKLLEFKGVWGDECDTSEVDK